MRTLGLTLGALAAGAWALSAAPAISGEAALRLVRAALVAGVVLAVQMGLGAALLRRIAPAMLDRPAAVGHALAIGIGAHALLLFPLLAIGRCDALGATLLLGALALPAVPGLVRLRALPSPAPGDFALFLLVAGLMLPAAFSALAPATDTDELSYLLALPERLAGAGALPVDLLDPEAARPLPVQLVMVAAWALGGSAGDAACRLWSLGVVLTLLATVGALVRARGGNAAVAVLALASSWSVVRAAGLAYTDLPVALWLVCAADALLTGRYRLMGLHAGLAFAAKYTAAPVCLALFATALLLPAVRAPGDRRRVLLALILAGLPVLPWWIRNAWGGLHPLFPFAGWPPVPGLDFVFVYPEKYGMGHTWADAALLPFRVLFRAEPESMAFYGRLSLLWLGLLAVPVFDRPSSGAVARRLGVLTLAGFVVWALGAQILRYLLPVLGIAAMLLGTARLPRPAWVLLFAASLPSNLLPAWTRAASVAAVVRGAESADVYLTGELPPWPALRYLRDWVPREDPVALLASWGRYYIDQPYVLGSVEDHVPTRYWLALHGDDALRELHRRGVRWLLVGDLPGIRKSYAFLDQRTFNEQFLTPKAQLERLLLRDARRMFVENHTAVWRLDDPPTPP